MKVTELKTMVLEAEKPYVGGKYFLFLELYTDEGITGIGERVAGSSYSAHLSDLKSQVQLIEQFAKSYSRWLNVVSRLLVSQLRNWFQKILPANQMRLECEKRPSSWSPILLAVLPW